MKANFAKYYALIPLLMLAVFCAFRAIDFPAHDFANYYFGGKFLAQGKFSSWVYFPYEFNRAIAGLGYKNIFVSYAPNTPFLAVLFLPFSLLPLATAKLVFNIISVFLFLYSMNRFIDFYKISPLYILLLPVLFFVPLKNQLLFGQVYFLLFFALAESWLAYEKKQFAKMAILLSVAIFLKVFPVLLLLIFVFKKQFRVFGYVVACCLLLFIISISVTGADVWIFYFQQVLPRASNGEISEAFVVNYQSVYMFLKQLLVFDNSQNPNAYFNYPNLFEALVLAFKIKLFAIGFYVTRKSNNSLYLFAYWIFAAILISPYGSTYGFILLIPAYFALVKSPLPDVMKIFGCMLLFAICNVPVSVFVSAPFPFSYSRLIAVLLLLAVYLYWMFPYIKIRFVALVVAVPFFLVLWIPKYKLSNTHYALGENMPILIYDYSLSNNKLTYFYWNEAGENARTIPFENTTVAVAEIKENQIFRNGNCLTLDSSNKRKPTAISDDAVLYLSDAGRGIGFYTLYIVTKNTTGYE